MKEKFIIKATLETDLELIIEKHDGKMMYALYKDDGDLVATSGIKKLTIEGKFNV